MPRCRTRLAAAEPAPRRWRRRRCCHRKAKVQAITRSPDGAAGVSCRRADGFSSVLGRKTTAAATTPNMAIRNSDVIAQAMGRLPLYKAWTVPPKARRANAVAPPRVGSPLVSVTARRRFGVPSGRANERTGTAQRLAHHATAAAGSLARVVLQLARFLGVGAINPMRAAYACFSIGIAGVSYGQELKGRCAKKPL
jgi:hypothetical protein